MASVVDVLTRYDELAALPASIAARPLADPADCARAGAVLHREARLLDARAFPAWLATCTDDAVLWVPLCRDGGGEHVHPATDQSWFLDDRRRLGERVAWHAEPSVWGQHPPSTCVRTIGTVEAWPTASHGGGGLVVHSTFTLVELRLGEVQVLAGHQVHELAGPELRVRSKVLIVPQLAAGLRNPSFLL